MIKHLYKRFVKQHFSSVGQSLSPKHEEWQKVFLGQNKHFFVWVIKRAFEGNFNSWRAKNTRRTLIGQTLPWKVNNLKLKNQWTAVSRERSKLFRVRLIKKVQNNYNGKLQMLEICFKTVSPKRATVWIIYNIPYEQQKPQNKWQLTNKLVCFSW